MSGPIHRFALLTASALVLAACANPIDDKTLNRLDIFDLGWGSTPEEEVVVVKGMEIRRYCYSTLARPDCHGEPLPDEPGRLIGFVGPPPPGYVY